MTPRYPIKVHTLNEGGLLKFKVAIPLERALQDAERTERELRWVELDYEATISAAKNLLKEMPQVGKKDPRIYWLIGDALRSFLERLEMGGYYLQNQNSTFARDLEFSASSVKKVLSFRRHFANPFELNPHIPWNRYRNHKV